MPSTCDILGPRKIAQDVVNGRRTESHVHSNPYPALDSTTNVVAIPGNTLRDIGIDAGGEKEAASVLDMWAFGCNEHDKPRQCDAVEADHEDTASLESVCQKTSSNAAEACHNVRRDRHELSSFVRVAEGLHDRWQEERHGVKRGIDPKLCEKPSNLRGRKEE